MEEPVTVSLPDILASLCRPDYSEANMMSTLEEILEVHEEPFLQVFLQFIVDCAELDEIVTTGTHFRSVLIRSGSEPSQFLAYRDVTIGQSIDHFLKVYLVYFKPFVYKFWSEKVLELLQALVNADETFSICGVYFVMQLLFNSYCIQNDTKDGEESIALQQFCQSLFQLYDYKLLNDENFNHIAQKLDYLFQFYWEPILTGDPMNIRHLTALLYVNNNQLKKSLLKTILNILTSDHVTGAVHQTIMSELVLMKDILIAMCHQEPVPVVLQALSLLSNYPHELAPEPSDKHKIFLLLVKPKPKIQEMAVKFFQNCIQLHLTEQGDGQRDTQVFLSTLEDLVSKCQDVNDNLDVLVEVLSECFPSFVDIYLYIINNDSEIISHLSTILIKSWVRNTNNTIELGSGLVDIAKMTRGVLQQLSSLNRMGCYQDILLNFQIILNMGVEQICSTVLKDISDHLQSNFDERHQRRDLLRLQVTVWLKINSFNIEDIGEIIIRSAQNNKWIVLGWLLEELTKSQYTDLAKICKELQFPEGDVLEKGFVDIINVKHLVITRMTDNTEVLQLTFAILEFIREHNLIAHDGILSNSSFGILLRATVNLMLKLICHLDSISADQIKFYKRFEKQLFDSIQKWDRTIPEIVEWQRTVFVLLEFSSLWMNEKHFSEFLLFQLQSAETLESVPDIFKAIYKNRICESDVKMQKLVLIVGRTLQKCNQLPSVKQAGMAAKKLLSSIIEYPDPPFDINQLLMKTLIQLLRNIKDFLCIRSNEQQNHHFKALDVLLDKLPAHITSEDRRIVLAIIADIQLLAMNENEKATIQRLFSILP